MAKWNSGGVVELKSGGPDMTVQHYSSSGSVVCQWFDGAEMKNGTFNENSLKKSDSDE